MTIISGYKVTVSAITERVETSGRDWKVVGQEPAGEGDGRLKDKYGYTPEIQKTIQREQNIYEQRVEVLDLAALVSVVNGLPVPQR